jgi:hypothetical protein
MRGFQMRTLALLLVLASAGFGATIRLFLKEGGHHMVREYKVEGDRVRFYSTERGDWEEMPLELVDLKKTEAELRQKAEAAKADLAAQDAEEKAERDLLREIERVPRDAGVYQVDAKEVKTPETKVNNNKRRSVLKVLSPIPVITGKATLEVDGVRAAYVVTQERPEFWIRIKVDEQFGIAKLTEHNGNRVVEKLTIVPVTKETIEEPAMVEVFRKQYDDTLYKIWPIKALEPGCYAVVQFTDGKLNMQVWDFDYRPQ